LCALCYTSASGLSTGHCEQRRKLQASAIDPQPTLTDALLAARIACVVSTGAAFRAGGQDLKPADPDTGESTVQESTLGLLPNPLEKWGVKSAATYIGEILGNPIGGLKQSAIYEGRPATPTI